MRKVHETPAISSQTVPFNQPTDTGTKDKESFSVSDPSPSVQSIYPPVLASTPGFERQNPSQGSVVSGQNYLPPYVSGQNHLLAGFPGQAALGLSGFLGQNMSPAVFSGQNPPPSGFLGQNLSPIVPNPSPNNGSDQSHHPANFSFNNLHIPGIPVRNPPPFALSAVLDGSHNGLTYQFPNIVTESGSTYQIL